MRRILCVCAAAVLALAFAGVPSNATDTSAEADFYLGIPVVVSASLTEERVTEVPVPVTTITKEMINSSGARKLLDLLVLFVPGMTYAQDANEYNVAERGVYGSAQQKILMMVNGHRINSRAYAAGAPDGQYDLDAIERIEVLRGPGASFYGNIALTAVVNIVTKNGGDVNGTEVSLGFGDFGQKRASFLHGKKYNDTDNLLVWGHAFEAEGEKRFVPAAEDFSDKPTDGFMYVDSVKDHPSFDVGMNLATDKLDVLVGSRRGRYVEPLTSSGNTGEAYNYEDYEKYLGTGTGLQFTENSVEVRSHNRLGGNWKDELRLYFDAGYTEGVLLDDPNVSSKTAVGFGLRDWNLGVLGDVQRDYETSGHGKGRILLGFQVEKMRMDDGTLLSISNGTYTTVARNKNNQLLERGEEVIYSGFTQLRHDLMDGQLILNAGARYDAKDRHLGPAVSDVSPRMAVIYAPGMDYNLKLSFAKSFVDAPYWYRYNTLGNFKGSAGLQPEHLTSVQLTQTVTAGAGTRLTTNLFRNKLKDFVFRDPTVPATAPATSPRYKNAGFLTTWGLEQEVEYKNRALTAFANATYQKVIDAKDYPVHDDEIDHVPQLTLNAHASWNPFQDKARFPAFNANVRYVGEQAAPITATSRGGVAVVNGIANRVDAAVIVDAGITLAELGSTGLSIKGFVYNVLDKDYEQGGTTSFPYPQAGRWYFVSTSLKF